MRKKVIEFIGRLQDGGAETLVKDYALLMNKDKFDVLVLCADYNKESNVYKTLVANNVRIKALYEKSFFMHKALARILGQKHIAKLLIKVIKEEKPDVIHVHSEILQTMYYARDYLNGIKICYTCHNPPQLLIGDQRPNEKRACRYLLDQNHLQLIALHQDMANEINELFNIDNTVVIRNGINFNTFLYIKKSKEEIKRNLGLDENSYVIGQVGRFAYQKNPEFTINVFSELIKKKDNAVLLLIGRGKQEKQLRDLIQQKNLNDKVFLLTNRDDVPELLKAMDVFVLPSRFEGLGIVLIEAQVSGLPCVVSDNVPFEAFKSPNIVRLSLDDSIDKWVDALLSPKGNINTYGDIDEYDMNKEIINLEKIYSEQ